MKRLFTALVVAELMLLLGVYQPNVHADPLPTHEFLDLNDSQVPAGWTQELHWVGPGVQEGRFWARVVDGEARLKRTGTLPVGATAIRLEYDGNIAYSYWGLINGAGIRLSIDTFGVYDAVAEYNWGLLNKVRVIRYPVGSLYDEDYPLEYADYHYTAIFSEGQIRYKGTKILDGQVLFDVLVNEPALHLSDVQEVFFYAHTTTINDCWMDNLQLTVVGGEEWCDDFESYAPGSNASPPWYLSGNTSGVTVDNTTAYSGEKSLRMFGILGGCWGVNAVRQYSGLPLLITMAVRNGSEPLSGCHPYRASLVLRTGCPDWWCCPCPELFGFLANGDFRVQLPGNGPTVFSGYPLEVWQQVKCYLWTPGDGSLHVKYWVNGEYLGEFLTPEEPWMQTVGYLDIASQEGMVWFDDICVSHEAPPGAEICEAFITPQHVRLRCILSLDREAPGTPLNPWRRPHSFMIHLQPCAPMDVSIGDSADVFVDVDASGVYDPDERYAAVVSGVDVEGAASDIAIKVYVECDLIDNDPHVAIYAVGGLNLVDSDGNPIDYLQVDTFDPGAVSGGTDDTQLMALAVILHPNYPNPFNPQTEIRLTLPNAADVQLDVYNILGRRVATLVGGNLAAGEHIIQWDGKSMDGQSLASGIYFYRLTAGDFVETRKMVLMK